MTTIFDYNNGLHLNIIKNINPTTKKPEHIIEYSYDTQYQNCIIVIFFKQQLFYQIFISTYVAKQKYTYKCTKLDAQQTTQTSDFYVTYIYNCLNKNNAEAYAKTLVANMGKFTIHVDKGLFYSHRTKKGLAIFYNSTDKKLKVIVSGAVFTIDKGQTLERKFSYAPSITSVYPHNKEMLTYNEMGVPTDYLPMEINSTVPRMINRHTSFKWKKKTDFIPVHMELVYINSYKKSEILLRDECTSI